MIIRKEMKYTAEQGTALAALADVTKETYADMVRRLVGEEAARHGIVFPQNMPTKKETARKAIEVRWTNRR